MIEEITLIILIIHELQISCQTIEKVMPACFGNINIKRPLQLINLMPDLAYELKTPNIGIPVNVKNDHYASKSCGFSLTSSNSWKFTFFSIYFDFIYIQVKYPMNYSIQLTFSGYKKEPFILYKIELKAKKKLSNFYVQSNYWHLSPIITISMFRSNAMQDRSVQFYAKFTITPIYNCYTSLPYSPGTNIHFNFIQNFKMLGFMAFDSQGWLICSRSINTSQTRDNINSHYSAPCIDYKLTCDGKINCPQNHFTHYVNFDSSNDILTRLQSIDENHDYVLCYSAKFKWLMYLVIALVFLNCCMILFIIYVCLLRYYSPIQFLRIQATILKYCCCCLPDYCRSYLAGNSSGDYVFNPLRRISSDCSDLPQSPPTYQNVQHARLSTKSKFKLNTLYRKTATDHLAHSGHHLPPSYNEATDEIGVSPELVIKNMYNFGSTRQHTTSPKSSGRLSSHANYIQRYISAIYAISLNYISNHRFWNRRTHSQGDLAVITTSHVLPTYVEFTQASQVM